MDHVEYASIPQGVDYDPRKFVCKLDEAIYGLAIVPMR